MYVYIKHQLIVCCNLCLRYGNVTLLTSMCLLSTFILFVIPGSPIQRWPSFWPSWRVVLRRYTTQTLTTTATTYAKSLSTMSQGRGVQRHANAVNKMYSSSHGTFHFFFPLRRKYECHVVNLSYLCRQCKVWIPPNWICLFHEYVTDPFIPFY